jgi:hypothetical protein
MSSAPSTPRRQRVAHRASGTEHEQAAGHDTVARTLVETTKSRSPTQPVGLEGDDLAAQAGPRTSVIASGSSTNGVRGRPAHLRPRSVISHGVSGRSFVISALPSMEK